MISFFFFFNIELFLKPFVVSCTKLVQSYILRIVWKEIQSSLTYFALIRDQIKRFGIANYKSLFICSESNTTT